MACMIRLVADWSQVSVGYTTITKGIEIEKVADWSQVSVGYT